LFALPLLLAGCVGFEEIKIVRILDVRYEELRGSTLRMAVVVKVDNPNRFDVRITNANMVLRLQDRVLGNVTQVEQVEILGRTEADYTIRFSVEMRDVMANMMTLYRVFMNEPTNLNLSGTVHVRSFLYSRTFHVERLTFQ
jgi:LEA14-like dessication related protein